MQGCVANLGLGYNQSFANRLDQCSISATSTSRKKSSYLNDILTELIIVYETIMNSNLKSLTESIFKEIQYYSEHKNGRKRSYNSKTLIFKHWKDEFNNLINPYFEVSVLTYGIMGIFLLFNALFSELIIGSLTSDN